eukprot:307933-Amphidinium_carterae.1
MHPSAKHDATSTLHFARRPQSTTRCAQSAVCTHMWSVVQWLRRQWHPTALARTAAKVLAKMQHATLCQLAYAKVSCSPPA